MELKDDWEKELWGRVYASAVNGLVVRGTALSTVSTSAYLLADEAVTKFRAKKNVEFNQSRHQNEI